MTTTTGEAPHIYSSTLNYYMACPGYLPDEFDRDSPFAIEGELLHEVMETGDRGKLDPENKEHHALVDSCEDCFHTLFPKFESCKNEIVLQPIIKGTRRSKIDRYVKVKEGLAGALDWKFGRNAVPDAQDNWQGRDYAMRLLLSKTRKLDTLVVAFVLPRRNEVSTATFKRKDAEGFRTEIEQCVERVRQVAKAASYDLLKPGTPVAGKSVCTYCARKASCPALCERAVALAEDRAEVKGKEPINWAHPSTINDPAVIARMKDAVPILKAWCKSVDFRANELFFQEGLSIPGYTVGCRAGKRSLGAPEEVFAAMQEIAPDITPLDFIRACDKVSITKLEDVVGENAKRGEKKAAKEAVCRTLIEEGLLTQGEEKEILVKEK